MTIKRFIPGIVWLIISIILLSLPGNDLPKNDLFNIPYFDKYVHTGMFFLLTFLFAIPIVYSLLPEKQIKAWFVRIALLVILYGVAMEYVQKYFVIGRSFDVVDILFDGVGSIAGLIVVAIWYTKSRVKK